MMVQVRKLVLAQTIIASEFNEMIRIYQNWYRWILAKRNLLKPKPTLLTSRALGDIAIMYQ